MTLLWEQNKDQEALRHDITQEALFKTKCTLKDVYICDFIFPDTIVNMNLFFPQTQECKK